MTPRDPSGLPPLVAYFSMEAGLDPSLPTYSGGLGVLSGDTLRSAADLSIPAVGVTLLHRKGYFRQRLDAAGVQTEEPDLWSPEESLERLEKIVTVTVEGRPVRLRAWRFSVRGVTGHTIPVYLLDSLLPENDPFDQSLTDHLYAGDRRYRLCQEVILGMGGVAMLEALGHQPQVYHMNEGHSALLTLALVMRRVGGRGLSSATDADCEAVEAQCVFTTHTPVPAGHDRFEPPLVTQVLGNEAAAFLAGRGVGQDGALDMTALALYFCRYVNGVAMRHAEVSQLMFPTHTIRAITNGVHAATWTAPPFAALFDRHIPEWRRDNLYLRYAMGLPLHEIERAHAQAKQALLDEVAARTGMRLDPGTLTLGFARRSTPYKRATLLFSDLDRLRAIARYVGPLQVLYAGKAHPHDDAGKALIQRIVEAARELGDAVRVLYLENYDMTLAQQLCAGVDLWLNTPLPPQEASGTSGMKAAMNGVPSFSVLDGWWIEGHLEGVTGWAIGDRGRPSADGAGEAAALYDKLEHVIAPLFYARPSAYAEMMRACIAINGAFFNTQRMVAQYVANAYFPAGT